MERTYRNIIRPRGLVPFRVVVQETDLHIHARSDLEAAAREAVFEHRGYIEACIRRNPAFARTLTPWREVGPFSPVVAAMVDAGRRAGVGPMAAVAGALAEEVGRALLRYSPEVIVENGGDIFLKLEHPVTIGIFAGRSPLSMKIGLALAAAGRPVAVCTSSGTVGHSLSQGVADAVCVLSDSCALADAAATAIGNRVVSTATVQDAIAFGRKIEGVKGVVVIIGKAMGLWGEVEVVPLGEKKVEFSG